MLRDSLHQPQYVEKLEKIVRFMIKEKALALSDLDTIWMAQQGKHDAIVKVRLLRYDVRNVIRLDGRLLSKHYKVGNCPRQQYIATCRYVYMALSDQLKASCLFYSTNLGTQL